MLGGIAGAIGGFTLYLLADAVFRYVKGAINKSKDREL